MKAIMRTFLVLRLSTLLSLCFVLLLQVGVLAAVDRNGISSDEQQQQQQQQQQQRHRFHQEDYNNNSGDQSMEDSSNDHSHMEDIDVPESIGKAQATTSTSDTKDGFDDPQAPQMFEEHANANANADIIAAEPSRRILQDALRQVVDHVLDDHPTSVEYRQHEQHRDEGRSNANDSNSDEANTEFHNPQQQGRELRRNGPHEEQQHQHQHYHEQQPYKDNNDLSRDIRVAIADIDVDKLSDANADQIRQLLQSLADSNNMPPSTTSRSTTRRISEKSSSSFHEDDDYDDRTLLDIFGETAKHYLTQEMIPDTDVGCRWDWRSIRCEPACRCNLDLQFGDYHLGRSCRFRQAADEHGGGGGGGGIDPHCIDVHPAIFLRELPVSKRIISLSTQTFDILKVQSKQAARIARREFETQYRRLQERVCRNLWDLQAKQQQDPLFCLPERQVPTRRSMAEKVLCGPIDVEFNVCEDRMQDFMARKKKKVVSFADRL